MFPFGKIYSYSPALFWAIVGFLAVAIIAKIIQQKRKGKGIDTNQKID